MSKFPPVLPPEPARLAHAARILEEADDAGVPLLERVHFLGEAARHMDAAVDSWEPGLRMQGEAGADRLARFRTETARLSMRCERVLVEKLVPAMAARGIRVPTPDGLDPLDRSLVRTVFEHEVAGRVRVHESVPVASSDDLSGAWLVVAPREAGTDGIGLVSIPGAPSARMLTLPSIGHGRTVLFLDDILRANLDRLFASMMPGKAYAVILSSWRPDPESPPVRRLAYDPAMPYALMRRLMRALELSETDLATGTRYPRLADLERFPAAGLEEWGRHPWPPVTRTDLADASGPFAAVAARDRLLRYPYESRDTIRRFLAEAAIDPAVVAISMTLQAGEPDSDTARALSVAAGSRRRVTVIAAECDGPARRRLESLAGTGVRVVAVPEDRLPATSLLWIEREERVGRREYAYLETGSRTAGFRPVSSYGVLTADRRLAADVRLFLDFAAGSIEKPRFEHLLVSPGTLRRRLKWLIRTERKYRAAGRSAGICIRTFRLEDKGLIRRLQRAAGDGVPVSVIVQGSTRVGTTGDEFLVRSIVDRVDERVGVVWLENGDDAVCYLTSADWTKTDLRRRTELAFPVLEPSLRDEIREDLDRQLADTVKARRIAADGSWTRMGSDDAGLRSQEATWRTLTERHDDADEARRSSTSSG